MSDMNTTVLNVHNFREPLQPPVATIFLTQHPNTIEEIANELRAQGHSIEVIPFEHSGERAFGYLERVKFNGLDCVAKYIGPESCEMFEIRARGVQQERDGLILTKGISTPLIAEIRVDDQVVGIFRQFAEGESLRDAVASDKVTASEARVQVQELVTKLTASGLYLWDCNPSNIWRRPDGAVVLLEGQCVFPSDLNQAELLVRNMEIVDVMFPAG
jgi:hypothetical protein